MKFFLYKKKKIFSLTTSKIKYFKITNLLNILKLYKNFTFTLFDFLYYNIKYKKSSLIVLSKVTPFLIKKGNLFKNSVLLFDLFTKFYKIIFSKNIGLRLNDYMYYKEFFYNFSRYDSYKNINYLLNWIFFLIEPMFYVECSVVPKKYRKKLKKKYLYKIKYLNKNKRINKILNWITKYSNTIKNFKFVNRQLLVYLDLFLNYKNSYLYGKKLLVYKKVFKI